MAAVKLGLRKLKVGFSVVFVVYHRREKRYIVSGVKVEKSDQLVFTNLAAGDGVVKKNSFVSNVAYTNNLLQAKLNDLRGRLHLLDMEGHLVNMNVKELHFRLSSDSFDSFSNLAQMRIDNLKADHKFNTAKNYNTVLKFWKEFFKTELIEFSFFTVPELEKAKSSYLKTGSINGFQSIIKNTSALFHLAIKNGVLNESMNPFKIFKVRLEKTKKRAISKNHLQLVFNYKGSEFEQKAIHIFMVSFFCAGISIGEICKLKVSSVKNNILVYKRGKTADHFEWQIHEKIKPILDQWKAGKKNDEYLMDEFNVNLTPEKFQKKIGSYTARINKQLKNICEKLEIPKITTYTARHSWASLARDIGVELSVISEAMGHEDLKTTMIYLKEIDISTMNKANKLVGDVF